MFLNALKYFEAVARLGSFSGAAQELNVTPAAVGQQVRTLEGWLKRPLFIRTKSGSSRLTPTPEALAVLPELQLGFRHIQHAVTQLSQTNTHKKITVSVSPAFAAKWLLARIDDFARQCPDIDVRLDTTSRTRDYHADGIDVGVRYGPGKWPQLIATKLMQEDIFPVCSPKLLPHACLQINDILNLPLLHDCTMAHRAEFPSWHMWLAHHNIDVSHAQRGLKINNSAAVVQAAIDGQGVALGRGVLVHDDIQCGRLVRYPSESYTPGTLGYYVVQPEHIAPSPAVHSFTRWLLQMAITSGGNRLQDPGLNAQA